MTALSNLYHTVEDYVTQNGDATTEAVLAVLEEMTDEHLANEVITEVGLEEVNQFPECDGASWLYYHDLDRSDVVTAVRNFRQDYTSKHA